MKLNMTSTQMYYDVPAEYNSKCDLTESKWIMYFLLLFWGTFLSEYSWLFRAQTRETSFGSCYCVTYFCSVTLPRSIAESQAVWLMSLFVVDPGRISKMWIVVKWWVLCPYEERKTAYQPRTHSWPICYMYMFFVQWLHCVICHVK
jgi:hypothetical protein